MTIKTVGFIISGIFVFAFFVTAPAVLIYFVGTHEASIDPIISKIEMVACAHPENFTECSEGVMKLARETLEVREERINRWLYGIAGFLGLVTWIFTALAILIAVGGVIGTGHFRGLKEEAKDKIKELDGWVKKAKDHHDAIKDLRDAIKKNHDAIKDDHDAIKKHHDNIRDMKNNIKSDVDEFISNLKDFNQNRQIASEQLEEIQKAISVINELYKETDKIIAQSNMAGKSMDNIVTSEKTARGLEAEIREILDSLKDPAKKE